MQRELPRQDRTGLKARRIARDRRELILPQPAQRGLAVFHAEKVGRGPGGEGALFGPAECVVGCFEACADEQDVAWAGGQAGFGEDLLQVVQADWGCCEGS